VNSQLLTEDGWPRSREVATLARRIDAINWFQRDSVVRDPGQRLSDALVEHTRRLGAAAPASVNLRQSGEGRADIRDQHVDLKRPAWDALLRAPFDTARQVIRETGRARGHSLVLVSGEALLIRPEALPIQQETLWNRLQGPRKDRLPETTVSTLVDRVLWELGMAILWEMIGDLVGENPYESLLTVYEEGLYPLDLMPAGAVRLWLPSDPD